jgi:hypothetical protein
MWQEKRAVHYERKQTYTDCLVNVKQKLNNLETIQFQQHGEVKRQI